jgi:hypothetical protein
MIFRSKKTGCVVDNSTNCSTHLHTLLACIIASKRDVEMATGYTATYSSHSFTCCQSKMLRKANYGQLNTESFVWRWSVSSVLPNITDERFAVPFTVRHPPFSVGSSKAKSLTVFLCVLLGRFCDPALELALAVLILFTVQYLQIAQAIVQHLLTNRKNIM